MFRDEQLDEASIVDQVIRRHSALLARVVFVQVAHRPAQLLQVPDHDRIGFEVIVVVGGLQCCRLPTGRGGTATGAEL